MRRLRAHLFLVAIGSCFAAVASGEPPEVKATPVAKELSEVLSRLEVLAEAASPKSAVRARIYRVSDQGECDGTPDSCPKARLLVAVSEYDEDPAGRVFELPRFHNWEFVRWIKLAAAGASDPSVVFLLRASVPAKVPNGGWWESFELEVAASPYDAPTLKKP